MPLPETPISLTVTRCVARIEAGVAAILSCPSFLVRRNYPDTEVKILTTPFVGNLDHA